MPSQEQQLAFSSFLPAVMAAVAAEIIAAAAAAQMSSANGMEFNQQASSDITVKTEVQAVQKKSDDNPGEEARPNVIKKCSRKRAFPVTDFENEPGDNVESATEPSEILKESPRVDNLVVSPNAACLHKIRKLKLYSVEEKIDIIDYAKVIGNRAAGREFNVAESSIREWRKNEGRLRRQMEHPGDSAEGATTQTVQHFETANPEVIAQIDRLLVEFINGRKEGEDPFDWYSIRDKAREMWSEIAKDNESAEMMHISMGWIARFMSRCSHEIPKLAPPIISATGSNGQLSMVRCSNNKMTTVEVNPVSKCDVQRRSKRASRIRDNTLVVAKGKSEEEKGVYHCIMSTSGKSRRKSHQPRRVEDATLLTTTTVAEKPVVQGERQDPNGAGDSNKTTATIDFSQTCNALSLWLTKNCATMNGSV